LLPGFGKASKLPWEPKSISAQLFILKQTDNRKELYRPWKICYERVPWNILGTGIITYPWWSLHTTIVTIPVSIWRLTKLYMEDAAGLLYVGMR